jgi:hypothetical protein
MMTYAASSIAVALVAFTAPSMAAADIDRDDLVAFEFEGGLIQSFRNGQVFRYQTREAAAPVLDRLWSKCGLHDIHHLGHGKCTSLGDAITQQFQAKEMVRVPMRNIDGRETPFRGGNPVGKLRGLLIREKGIDQQCLALAVNQRCRISDPFQIIIARRCALGRACTAAYE